MFPRPCKKVARPRRAFAKGSIGAFSFAEFRSPYLASKGCRIGASGKAGRSNRTREGCAAGSGRIDQFSKPFRIGDTDLKPFHQVTRRLIRLRARKLQVTRLAIFADQALKHLDVSRGERLSAVLVECLKHPTPPSVFAHLPSLRDRLDHASGSWASIAKQMLLTKRRRKRVAATIGRSQPMSLRNRTCRSIRLVALPI